MSELRALLLTDVVDSTKLSEEIGDAAMAEVWLAHDRLARGLLPVWRGREIDKTDGMLLLFDQAADAVGYAMAYHQGLASLPRPLKARAGLHVGPVLLRENPPDDVARGAKPLEVEGLAKPIAARVMSVARGGQTLLTPEARQALAATALSVHSHGHWMLKGISEPTELFEVGEPGTRFTAPPGGEKAYRVVQSGDRWLSLREIPSNLPQQSSAFIGRERELDELKEHLARARLVTALGMGGLGKTRLTLQVAADVMAEYPEGVWFLDLAPIRDPALVVGEAAQVMEVREEPGRPLLQSLCTCLRPQRVLIVLDNCEHLGRAPADLAHAILRAAPRVRILASSREPLHVPGEQTYPVLPLPLPKKGDSVDAMLQSTSVRLFVERARSHRPAFALTDAEAPAVAELVTRLEGIPLALELAAARVRSLSVAEINKRLSDRFKILTGGARVLQERQQTLRALVDWSYDLLGPEEQTLFGRLAVFVGGFGLDAAERVCGIDPLTDVDVLDLLASLVDKSLVMAEQRQDGDRYRMLETLREYALEKLVACGEADRVRAAHCDHYFGWAKQARDGLRGPEQAEWVSRVEVELDNIRAALATALGGGGDPVIGVKIAVAMLHFWILRGYATEGRAVVRTALALPQIQGFDLAQAHALYVGAALATTQSDHAEARRMLEVCLELRRRLGNPTDIAATLSTLSLSRLMVGDAAGAAASEREALEIFRRLENRHGEAIGLLHLGQVAMYSGNDGAAQADIERSRVLARQIADPELEAECELMLGHLAFVAGDMAAATSRYARSLEVCLVAGDRRGEANAIRWLGRVELEGGQVSTAGARLGQALEAFRQFEMRDEMLGCLEDVAALGLAKGQAEPAVRVAAAAVALRERLGLARSPRGERRWGQRVEALRAALAAPAFDAAWAEGRGWEFDRLLVQALALAAT
jgi:predicted ATPase/class 3 adenylate cyclase